MITIASPARLMSAALTALGLANASGDWQVTYGPLPADDPTRRLACMSSSPVNHARLPDGDLSQHLGVQVMVRDFSKEAGYVKCLQIINTLLSTIKPTTPVAVSVGANTVQITSVMLASGPIDLGTQEGNNAHLHSVNFMFAAKLV